jgi:hypothetical protein
LEIDLFTSRDHRTHFRGLCREKSIAQLVEIQRASETSYDRWWIDRVVTEDAVLCSFVAETARGDDPSISGIGSPGQQIVASDS